MAASLDVRDITFCYGLLNSHKVANHEDYTSASDEASRRQLAGSCVKICPQCEVNE